MEELPLHSTILKYYFPKGLPSCHCPKLLDKSTVALGTGRHGDMCLRVKEWLFFRYQYCAAEYRVKDEPGNLQLIWVTIAAAAYLLPVLIRNKTHQRDRPNSTASFLLPNSLCAILNSLDYFILIPSPPSNRSGGIRKLLYFWIWCPGMSCSLKEGHVIPGPRPYSHFSVTHVSELQALMTGLGVNHQILLPEGKKVPLADCLRRLFFQWLINNPVLFPVSFFLSLGDTQGI